MGVLELEGMKFTRLLVVGRAENTPNGAARWNCLCDCGRQKAILERSLVKGVTKSCGCFRKEILSKKTQSMELLSEIVLAFLPIKLGLT